VRRVVRVHTAAAAGGGPRVRRAAGADEVTAGEALEQLRADLANVRGGLLWLPAARARGDHSRVVWWLGEQVDDINTPLGRFLVPPMDAVGSLFEEQSRLLRQAVQTVRARAVSSRALSVCGRARALAVMRLTRTATQNAALRRAWSQTLTATARDADGHRAITIGVRCADVT
jgi:hypothetical protein